MTWNSLNRTTTYRLFSLWHCVRVSFLILLNLHLNVDYVNAYLFFLVFSLRVLWFCNVWYRKLAIRTNANWLYRLHHVTVMHTWIPRTSHIFPISICFHKINVIKEHRIFFIIVCVTMKFAVCWCVDYEN